MSKLLDNVEAIQTGRVKFDEFNPLVVTIEDGVTVTDVMWEPMYEYRIGVRLGFRAYAKSTEEIPHLKTQAKRMIIEEVFGEFRKPMYEVRHAIMCGDRERARDLLDHLFNDMFGVK